MGVLSSPTIEDMITNVRTMLNQPSSTNSAWTDEELAVYLNEGVRRYFAEVTHYFEGQFDTQSDLNIVANTETVALPADCYEIKALYRKVGGGYTLLPYRNNLTEGYSTIGGTGGDAYVPYYYFRRNNVVLRPVPNFSETAGLRLEYVAFPETLVTGGDSLTSGVSPVFKDLVEMYAVYKAKLKESMTSGAQTYGPAKENLNDLFLAFKEAVVGRSASVTAIKPWNPEDI